MQKKLISSFSAEKACESNPIILISDQECQYNLMTETNDDTEGSLLEDKNEEDVIAESGVKPNVLPNAKFLPSSMPHKALKMSISIEFETLIKRQF